MDRPFTPALDGGHDTMSEQMQSHLGGCAKWQFGQFFPEVDCTCKATPFPAPQPERGDESVLGQRGRLDPAEVPALRRALFAIREEIERHVQRGQPYSYSTSVNGGTVTSRRGDLCDLRDSVGRIIARGVNGVLAERSDATPTPAASPLGLLSREELDAAAAVYNGDALLFRISRDDFARLVATARAGMADRDRLDWLEANAKLPDEERIRLDAWERNPGDWQFRQVGGYRTYETLRDAIDAFRLARSGQRRADAEVDNG